MQLRKIANKLPPTGMQVACKLPDRTVAKSSCLNEEPFDYSNSLYQRVVFVLKYDGKVEMSINAYLINDFPTIVAQQSMV